MRYLIITLVLGMSTCARTYPLESESSEDLDSLWREFKTTYGKEYEGHVEPIRNRIWKSNWRYIQNHNKKYNAGIYSYSLAMNSFGDLTHDEFVDGYLSNMANVVNDTAATFMRPLNMDSYPLTFDWRSEGYVTRVKNQGDCGSCWSFAAIGALEGQYFRKTGQLVDFSEQQLVDCSFNYHNNGCDGGYITNSYQYLQHNGVETEQEYPYIGDVGNCEHTESETGTRISGYGKVDRFNEDDLLAAVVTVGPISVAIDASRRGFQFYKGGVYDDPTCSSWQLNHAVLVVGYGYEDGQSHWIVKNSWSSAWGQDGYILMSRYRSNRCGIASQASYPIF